MQVRVIEELRKESKAWEAKLERELQASKDTIRELEARIEKKDEMITGQTKALRKFSSRQPKKESTDAHVHTFNYVIMRPDLVILNKFLQLRGARLVPCNGSCHH